MGTYQLVTPIRGSSVLLEEWAGDTTGMSAVRLYEGSNCDICGTPQTVCVNDHGPRKTVAPEPVPVAVVAEPIEQSGDDDGEGYTPAVAQPEFQDG